MSTGLKYLLCLVLIAVLSLASTKVITPSCSNACPDIYDPVCARCSDELMTFASTCEMNIRNCHLNDCLLEFLGECNNSK